MSSTQKDINTPGLLNPGTLDGAKTDSKKAILKRQKRVIKTGQGGVPDPVDPNKHKTKMTVETVMGDVESECRHY